ncbi:hypothetical protein SAMN05519104_8348 [Rhizobiales bacterium GAS188]|nr:hypothetical protein SAMN05519104_8348 [Rhizobiales bacterium GAS188]
MMRFVADAIAAVFGFVSGVVRNARTFHPDGRTFVGTVSADTWNTDTSDPALRQAGKLIEGRVLLRIGMGVAKKSWPTFFRSHIPDAPSIAGRFSPSPDPDAISRTDRGPDELDILFTAGGDRLWKLILNLATGGRGYGLKRFDYFQNQYFAEIPYRVTTCGLNIWLRLRAANGVASAVDRANSDKDREQILSQAVERGAELVIEAQSAIGKNAPFLPFAKIRFDREINTDQEALHFQPFASRGFEPYGVLATLRERVYPVSQHARPPNSGQRTARDQAGFFCRLLHGPYSATDDGRRCFSLRRTISALGVLLLGVTVVGVAYGAWRFLPNYPVTNNPPDQPGHVFTQEEIDGQLFKYGSTGGEANLGIPLLIWQAIPLVCAKTLKSVVGNRMAADYVARVHNYSPRPERGPDRARLALSVEGFRALGLIFETDKGTVYESDKDGTPKNIPVGVSMRRNLGFDRVFVNCAVCHSSTVRTTAASKPVLVLGMPANLLDLRNFEDFLFSCTSGADFDKDNLIPEIERMNGPLSLLDHYILYPVAIWIIRDRVQYLSNRLGFFAKQPDWGPGRVDTFSNAKGIFNWPWQKLPDWHKGQTPEKDEIGTVDFPSIWNQEMRKTRSDGCPMELHWDGNNDAVEERDLSAAFGTGALPPIIDHINLGKIEKNLLLDQSMPPRFAPPPFAGAIDQQLAEQKGKPIYNRLCANCHGINGTDFRGAKVGFVTPIEDIRTDHYRLDNYTEELSSTQAMLYAGEKKIAGADNGSPPLDEAHLKSCGWAAHGNAQENTYRFKRFHKTNGYANQPLDGVWLRAPYLHNGSVPTLWDLLHPVAQRHKQFWRGNDLYDTTNMGFVFESATAPDGTYYFRYDTSEPGNSNSGHEGHGYGTDLSDGDRTALIEYLKTF